MSAVVVAAGGGVGGGCGVLVAVSSPCSAAGWTKHWNSMLEKMPGPPEWHSLGCANAADNGFLAWVHDILSKGTRHHKLEQFKCSDISTIKPYNVHASPHGCMVLCDRFSSCIYNWLVVSKHFLILV